MVSEALRKACLSQACLINSYGMILRIDKKVLLIADLEDHIVAEIYAAENGRLATQIRGEIEEERVLVYQKNQKCLFTQSMEYSPADTDRIVTIVEKACRRGRQEYLRKILAKHSLKKKYLKNMIATYDIADVSHYDKPDNVQLKVTVSIPSDAPLKLLYSDFLNEGRRVKKASNEDDRRIEISETIEIDNTAIMYLIHLARMLCSRADSSVEQLCEDLEKWEKRALKIADDTKVGTGMIDGKYFFYEKSSKVTRVGERLRYVCPFTNLTISRHAPVTITTKVPTQDYEEQ